jgi:hypothetical protein
MAFEPRGEHLRRFVVGVYLQQVVAPIEDVRLGRRHVRGALILVVGGDEVFGALVDIAEKVVQLRRILCGQHPLDLRARLVEIPGLEQRQREVVTAVVVIGIDGAGAPQVRKGRIELALLRVEGGQLVLRVEAVRITTSSVCEPPLGGGGRSC